MQFDNIYGFIKRFNPMLFWREHFLGINRCEMAFIRKYGFLWNYHKKKCYIIERTIYNI